MHPRGREALRDVAKVLRFCFRAFAALLVIAFTHGATAPQTLWVRDLDDPDLIPAFSGLGLFLSPGPEGSVYFATDQHLTVGRLDADGNLLFKKKMAPFVTAFLSSRTTDSTGNLILGGKFTGQIGAVFGVNAPLLLKVSPEGTLLWSRPATNWGGAAGFEAVSADTNGNIYAGGYYTGQLYFGVTNLSTLQGDTDPFLAKFSPDGNLLWVQAGAARYDSFNSVSVDAAGDVWASASRLEPSPLHPQTYTGAIQKLRPDGGLIFEKPRTNRMILFAKGTLEPFLWSLYWRLNANLYQVPDSQLARLESNGDVRWFKDYFNHLFLDGDQDSENSTYSLNAANTYLLTKSDMNGNLLWSKSPSNLGGGRHTITVADPSTLYLGGPFGGYLQPATIDYFALPRTNSSFYIAKFGQLPPRSKPLLTLPPRDLELIEGHKGYIVAGAASGAQPQFQWFFNNVALPNETNTYITLDPTHRSHAGDYKIRISNSNGVVTSAPIHLTVRIPPSIIEQPAAQTTTAGQTVALRVVAAGDEPLNYLWRFNGSPMQGRTNATLEFTNITYLQQGEYTVTVANFYGQVTSAKAYLTVLSPPILSRFIPPERSIIAGSTLILSASIVGTPSLQYQWFENGIPIIGATASSLTLPKNHSSGPFTVVASNDYGSVTNDRISLHLTYPLSVVATNQTNNFRYLALGKADASNFFALRGPPAETSASRSYLERFDLSLKPVWPNPVAITGSLAFARDIAVDFQTNIYVLGDFKGELAFSQLTAGISAPRPALFLGRVSASGNAEWVTPFGLSNTNRAGKVRLFNGSVWTAGNTLATVRPDPEPPEVTFTNVHIAQFDPAGSLLWSNTISTFPQRESWTNPPSGITFGDFAVDADTNLFVGGTVREFIRDAAPHETPALIKYDAAGQIIWTRFYTNRSDRLGRVSAVKLGPDNDVYVCGFFAGATGGGFLARVATNGEQRWLLHSSAYFNDFGPVFQSIDFLPNGNLLVGGQSSGLFVVGVDPLRPVNSDIDPYSPGAFALEFSTDGKIIAPTIFGQINTTILALLPMERQIVAAGFATGQPTRGQQYLLGGTTPRITNAFRHYVLSPHASAAVRPQVTGSGPVSFQWLFNETPMADQTNAFLNLDASGATRAGLYQLVVQNSLGAVTSQPIIVSHYSVEYTNSRPRLVLELPETKTYRLDYRDDFTPETYWDLLQTFTGGAEPIIVEDPEIKLHRFFRLVPQ